MWRIAFVPITFIAATMSLLYVVATLPEVQKKKEPEHYQNEDVIISGSGLWGTGKAKCYPVLLMEGSIMHN